MAWWSAVVVHRTDFTSDALTNEFSCFWLSLKSKKRELQFFIHLLNWWCSGEARRASSGRETTSTAASERRRRDQERWWRQCRRSSSSTSADDADEVAPGLPPDQRRPCLFPVVAIVGVVVDVVDVLGSGASNWKSDSRCSMPRPGWRRTPFEARK